jgi:hypothetical protein
MARTLEIKAGENGARLLGTAMSVASGTLAGDVVLIGTTKFYVHTDRDATTLKSTISPHNGSFTLAPVLAADIALLAASAGDGTLVNFHPTTRAITFGAPVAPAFTIGQVHKDKTEILAL